jgi:hypothetical protein
MAQQKVTQSWPRKRFQDDIKMVAYSVNVNWLYFGEDCVQCRTLVLAGLNFRGSVIRGINS